MTIFDATPCRLGEGPLWHPGLKQLFWFDILEKRLYTRSAKGQHHWQFGEMVSAAVAASPFNADAWLAEREAFQRDFMQTLRQLVAERADAQRAQLAWRALAAHQMRSPRPAYRTYQESLLEYNCAFFARLHNTTTPEQRQRAAARLKDWEDDVRALVQPTAS